MIRSRILACATTVVLAACAHPRPPLIGDVTINAQRLSANLNQDLPNSDPHHVAASTARTQAQEFLTAIDSLKDRNTQVHAAACDGLLKDDISGDARTPVVPGHAIVLSGGSQNGAFGAGFLLGLQDKNGLPAEPSIVTGVSTGSLQATFAFLARQPVAADRTYEWLDKGVPTLVALPGADGEKPLVPGRTNLEDLALAYSITRESEILKPSALGDADILFKGAVATLDPLRRRLFALITPGTIKQVATEACRKRILLVGAVDVDDGNGYALDLTALALSAFDAPADGARMTRVRNAYVSALLASSSVPFGAMPVTLRYQDVATPPDAQQHMFIDGGARFGVFLTGVAKDYDVTLLVNTTLTTDPWIEDNPPAPTSGWLLIKLIPRTVEDILETQVYQLSVGKVEDDAKSLKMSYISNANIKPVDGVPPEDPMQHQYGKYGKCIDLKKEDALHNPIQFFPKYMACLIDYGRSRGDRREWNLSPIPDTAPQGAGTGQ
jgi:predicted acylesterase/phospholipase RssA